MGKREHEQGNITFTAAGYMEVMRAMRAKYNEHQDNMFNIAMAAHTELSKIKGIGTFAKRADKLVAFLNGDTPREYNAWRTPAPKEKVIVGNQSCRADVEHKDFIQGELRRGVDHAFTKPRRSAFVKLTNKDVSFSLDCNGEGTLSFNKETNSISWEADGKNAVQDAKKSVYYEMFVDVINAYKWRKKEGGVFYYGDESGEDAAREDGECYSDSPSDTFGPIGISDGNMRNYLTKKELAEKVKEFMRKHGR
jgi:hypothetical protein